MKGVWKKYITTAFLLAVFVVNLLGQDLLEIPKLTARATDLTGTLTVNELRSLESSLAEFEKAKGSQIIVLIVSTTEPEAIEQYAIRVADKWKIGREKVDDGVILILAKDDRKIRIEVGYGLEGAIPDALAKRIINNIIVPEFRSGNFFGGINNGVGALMGLVNGEPLPENEGGNMQGKKINKMMFMLLLFPIYLIIGSVVNGLLGNKIGAGVNIILFFIIGFFLSMSFVASGIFSGILSLISYNQKNRKGGTGRSYSRGWYVGGFGATGGYSSGGFGGGGFSGGGGGFGGGGASGGW